MYLLLIWLLSAQQPETVAPPAELQEAVSDYWQLLAVQDKAAALRFIHPEDLNNFIRRSEGAFSNWSLKSVEMRSEQEASVTVSFERLLLNAKLPQNLVETWVLHEGAWRVRIAKPVPVVERVRNLAREVDAKRRESTLAVFPRQLRFYALAPGQPASVTVRNGLDAEVRIDGLNLDETRIRVVESIEKVGPKETGRILLAYLGGDDEPNLASEIEVRLVVEGETRLFKIPVIINYSDNVTRWAGEKKRP